MGLKVVVSEEEEGREDVVEEKDRLDSSRGTKRSRQLKPNGSGPYGYQRQQSLPTLATVEPIVTNTFSLA